MSNGQRLAYEITASEVRRVAGATADELEHLAVELASRLDGADDAAVMRLADALRAAVHALRHLATL